MVTLETLADKFEALDGKIDRLIESFDGKFEALDGKFGTLDGKFEALDGKFTRLFSELDTKIDDLAGMTARGFSEVNERLDRHDERFESIEINYATKDDLRILGKNVERMIDTHIGIFQKSHEDLASRTKDLEKAVFAK